ncbi:MAG: hypothetical protein V3U14_12885 [candidate division NC10 bacterium]
MSSFADLYKQAEEEGAITSQLPEGGPFVGQITHTNADNTNGGKDRLGFRLKIIEGPNANENGWMNQVISPENPKAMAILFRILGSLGIDPGQLDAAKSAGDLNIAAATALGQVWEFTTKRRVNGDFVNIDVRLVTRLTDREGAAAPVAAPVVPAPEAVVSAPEAAVPVAAPSEAAPPVAVAPAAPAPVAAPGIDPGPGVAAAAPAAPAAPAGGERPW